MGKVIEDVCPRCKGIGADTYHTTATPRASRQRLQLGV